MSSPRPRIAPPGVLLTDLYQLTMLQGYFQHGMQETAVFELFFRQPPSCRNFYLAAGLEQALDYLEALRFEPHELAWLERLGLFRQDFLDYLAGLRFTGSVEAMPEGTPFFADEPILRVVAPLPEAQLVESRLINLVHFQTLVASKAARVVLVAGDRLLVDFGMRRAHGAEAGVMAARAAYLAGFAGTATVLAGAQFDIPVVGTMAHSFVQAHLDETAAFERFAESLPQRVVLLIDTYDTEAAARKVVQLAPRLAGRGIRVQGVRLDSGDLAAHARAVRGILDAGGLTDTTIFASGNLDEYRLRELLAAEAPIDGFGVGTLLDTSADAPYLDAIYKLQAYAGQPRRKRSEGKATWPGRKQVYRRADGDTLTTLDDQAEGRPLLEPVMQDGRRLAPSPGLAAVREYAREQLATLPAPWRALEPAPAYPVEVAPALRALADVADRLQQP